MCISAADIQKLNYFVNIMSFNYKVNTKSCSFSHLSKYLRFLCYKIVRIMCISAVEVNIFVYMSELKS